MMMSDMLQIMLTVEMMIMNLKHNNVVDNEGM